MSIIDFEIDEVKKICENAIPNSKIIACTAVLVRIDINQRKNRQLTACLRFPENYPNHKILIELKSKTLSTKFLDGLANLAENKAKEILGKPQVIFVLKFIDSYLQENPLCVAYDEIVNLKKDLGESASDNIKLKQKTRTVGVGSVTLTARGGLYYYKVRTEIPIEYPEKCIVLFEPETNLPAVLVRYLNGQSKEIARQCVEPPLKIKNDKNLQPFVPTPSVYKTLKFCIDATKDFHEEICPICNELVLPEDPNETILEDSNDMHCERVYCGHLYHQGCLKKYLEEPPFPKDGKLCAAKKKHPRSDMRYNVNLANAKCNRIDLNKDLTCGIRIAHDRWVVNIKLAETRWAQKQARHRELQEVVDFLQ